MRGCNHNAGVGLIIPGGKTQGGNGHQRIVNADMDAVGGQHTGGGSGKDVGIDAAVVGNGNQLASALGLYPVGQALGRLPDHIDIHSIGACAQNATQTGSAELQSNGKPIPDLLIVAGNLFQFPGQCGILQFRGGPTLVIV